MISPPVRYLLLLWGIIASNLVIADKPNSRSNSLTLTTWNLSWLAGDETNRHSQSTAPPRTSRDYLAMAAIIKTISPDVLAFQEVADHQAIGKVIPLNNYQIEFSSRKDKGNNDIWPQFVGFAIRNGIQYVRHPDLHQLDVWDNQYLRYGVDISLFQQGQPALRLLVVHLKSGCYSNRHRNKNCPVLAEQFEVLNGWISERQAHQQPFIIMGDFNRRLAEKGDTLWQQLTSGKLQVPRLSTQGRQSQCRSQAYNKRKKQWVIRQYPSFIDHFIIDGRIPKKDSQQSFSEYRYSDQQLKHYHLSDHCPQSITLQY